MGELIKQEVPETPMTFSGERYTTESLGQTLMEHLHRALMARTLCRGKDVLDIASGEGYGSALISQVARSVIGVDISEEAVAHATAAYGRENLSFKQGSAHAIPVADASVDVVISFETIEHFSGHETFLSEIRRVLKPGGLAVISTPDIANYSPEREPPNPYHVHEMSRDEFRDLMDSFFPHVVYLGQRTLIGSALILDEPLTGTHIEASISTYEARSVNAFERLKGLARSKYLVALASDDPAALNGLEQSLFVATSEIDHVTRSNEGLQREVDALRSAIHERDLVESRWQQDLETVRGSYESAKEQIAAMLAHLNASQRQLGEKIALANQLETQVDEANTEAAAAAGKAAAATAEAAIATAEATAATAEAARLRLELERVIENPRGIADPVNSRVWSDKAADLHRQEACHAASAAYRRSVILDDDNALAWKGLGITLREIGSEEEGVAALKRAFALAPCLSDVAVNLRRSGVTFQEMLDLAMHSASKRTSERGFTAWLGSVLDQREALNAERGGKPKLAARQYRELADRSTKSARLLAFGDAAARNAGLDVAIGAYMKAWSLAPENPRINRRLADLKHRSFGFLVDAKANLKALAGGSWQSLSDDPQFLLNPDGRRFPSGWTLISIRAESHTHSLRPILYAWYGKRGREMKAFTLPSIEGRGEIQCLLPLPEGITSLRLDPTSHANVSFRLHRAGWSCGAMLEGRQFMPAVAGIAFVGEQPTANGSIATTSHLETLELIPAHHLAPLPDGWFQAVGDDPQFDVRTPKALPQGWSWVEIEVGDLDAPLDPVLYAWSENESITIEMPRIERPGTLRRLVCLPEKVTALRFDPTAISGTAFRISALRIAPAAPIDRVYVPSDLSTRSATGEWLEVEERFTQQKWRVEPAQNLEVAQNDLFRSTDSHSTFTIQDHTSSSQGLVKITIEFDECPHPFKATLRALGNDGEVITYRLEDITARRPLEYHVYFPRNTTDLELRLDVEKGSILARPRISALCLNDERSTRYTCSSELPLTGLDASSFAFAQLVPKEQIKTIADHTYLATGDDPQFSVLLDGHPIPAGWTVVSVGMDVERELARPTLYLFQGDLVTEIMFPEMGSSRRQELVYFPYGINAIRLDPTDRADVAFSNITLSFAPADVMAGRLLTRHATSDDTLSYAAWCKEYDTLSSQDESLILQSIERMTDLPLISVLMPVYNPEPHFLRRALDTVRSQLYPNWELCIADDCSTNPEIRVILENYRDRDDRIKVVFREENGHISRSSNSALELVTGSFIALMDHDDELAPHALYLVAHELNLHPDSDIIYSDEDKIDSLGRRHDPHFKTDWNQELFYSQNMVAHLGVYRTSLVRAVEGFRAGYEGSQDYDFTLRILKLTSPERIRHIPHVLYHWRIFEGVRTFSSNNPSRSIDTARRALIEYFDDAEPASEVLPIEDFPSWWRIRRTLPETLPSVTIIIPTRDRINLVRSCLDGILNQTYYANLDVIIVDNGSKKQESLAYFEKIVADERVQVIRDDGAFNYSRLNNMASTKARGEYLCFLNNDIEIITPDWLSEMVAQAIQPGVGAVGTRLLYADGTLQHAGVTLGVYGVAAHGHRHLNGNSIGYFGHPQLVREVSAVTAAALLMPKAIFDEIGGFNANDLAVSYNDVDLCLRIGEAGYRIIYTPFAALFHLESASRGPDVRPEQKELQRVERGYMRARWGAQLDNDPFYNPNLTLADEDYKLAFPPRASRPWREEADIAEHLARIGRCALPEAPEQELRKLASDTAIIIASATPYAVLSGLARTFSPSLVPAAIWLVDNTPRRDAFDGNGHLAAVKASWPSLAIHIVDDQTQDFNASRTANLGLAAFEEATREEGKPSHLVILTEDCDFTSSWFMALLSSWHAVDAPSSVLSPRVLVRENPIDRNLQANGFIEEPVSLVAPDIADVLPMEEGYGRLPVAGRISTQDIAEAGLPERAAMIQSGIVMLHRRLLAPLKHGDGNYFDPIYQTQAARWEDLGRRLQECGATVHAALAPLAVLNAPRPRAREQRWQHWHDYFTINRRYHGNSGSGVLEFICPFHRGDVLIGLQVANTAHRQGIPLRFHVAESLMSWVEEFAPPFPVEPLPVPVPPAHETALHLLRSYEHVIGRTDASSNVAASHPARGLDAMNGNLASAMLGALGLPQDAPLENLTPEPTEMQTRAAVAMMAPFGDRTVLLHRSGGWGLKSLPDAALSDFAALVKQEGFRLIQIGGPNDVPFEVADGAINRNLSVGEWTALFRRASVVAGVDSWTSHMAALLDVPQITFYGSTHPKHVASKTKFRRQNAPALLIAPTVACSPCNSLSCLYQTELFCPGYNVDGAQIRSFLRNLK
ncbi:glycosyltransferase [Novosphingobium sp. BL-8A]|uniref:glycosyltransferase n=1 Tax=Novosphingobium sp. BL-8A TaxID=3127639 RepID=UPI003758113B